MPSPALMRASTGMPLRLRLDADRSRARARPPAAGGPVATSRRSPRSGVALGELDHVLAVLVAHTEAQLAEAELDRRRRRAPRRARRRAVRLAREDVIHALHHRHGGAHARHRLRHLDADRPGAEHQQPRGAPRSCAVDLAVRPHAVEPAQARRSAGCTGSEPGGDHDVLGGVLACRRPPPGRGRRGGPVRAGSSIP